jgi:hypothetical protein
MVLYFINKMIKNYENHQKNSRLRAFNLLLLLLLVCDPDLYNIELVGRVSDTKGTPIVDASIDLVIYVYDEKLSEARPIHSRLKTDKEGEFLYKYEKGEVIELKVVKSGYMNVDTSFRIESSKTNINLIMKRSDKT